MKQLVVVEVEEGISDYYVTVRVVNRPPAQILHTEDGGEVELIPPTGLTTAATLYFPERAFQVRNYRICFTITIITYCYPIF